jgi:hypothetical protein
MRASAVAVAVLLALAVTRAAGASGPVVSYTITAGTQGDNGWYRSAVTAQLSVQGATDSDCPLVKTFKTSADAVSCTATDGTSVVQFHLQFKIDTDAPTVTSAQPDRSPDGGGWYSHPVDVTFSGNDTTSGIASCTSATYSGPDSGSASVSGTCRDNAGNVSSSASFSLRYDTTAPTVTVTPSRPPDSNGWYSHPVELTFSGTDGGSGISACTAPVTYSGPDTTQATIEGGCVDAAGNRASTSTTLEYDSTPPKLADVAVSVASRRATVTWKAPADAATVSVTRARPGVKHVALVFRGGSSSSAFRDANLAPGTTYRYAVSATDAAGNTSTVDVDAAVPVLYQPAAGARIGAGAILAWAAAKGASYYNVQVFRGSRKVLSIWPTKPRLKLPRAWTFEGRRQRLAPGRYRWYVWPGRGPLKAAKYGKLLGGSTFVVSAGRS